MKDRLETPRLILKKAEMDDWKDMLFNVWRHEETAAYVFWSPIHTEEEARQRMEGAVRFQREQPGCFTLYEKASGQAVGAAGVEKKEGNFVTDRGLVLGPAFTGRGYGKEVLDALIRFSFEDLDADRFVYTCRTDNLASNRLALSRGFVLSCRKDVFFQKYGRSFPENYYELKREDWRKKQTGAPAFSGGGESAKETADPIPG